MKKIKVLSFSIALMSVTSVYAQTIVENKTTPYGDNPNIFTVIAKKTGTAVQNTAEKVGEATENGIRKIKPKFDETINNTKTYTAEQASIAKENTQKGIDIAVKKVEQTKDNAFGKTEYNVPIEQGRLSQPQIAQIQTIQSGTATSPVTTVLTPESATIISTQLPSSGAQNTPAEPEIIKQSLPIENSTEAKTEHAPAQTLDANDNSGIPR